RRIQYRISFWGFLIIADCIADRIQNAEAPAIRIAGRIDIPTAFEKASRFRALYLFCSRGERHKRQASSTGLLLTYQNHELSRPPVHQFALPEPVAPLDIAVVVSRRHARGDLMVHGRLKNVERRGPDNL